MRAFAIAGSLALLGLLGIAPPARADTKTLTAAMTAAEETPPGPQGGTGNATVTIDLAKNTLCYDLSWSKETGEPNAGHIHKGAKGMSGPTVVGFSLPDKPKDCLQVDNATLKQISDNPGGYYINLHTNRYPTGAIRGQLKAS
jgi:CHRD domain